MAKSAQVIKTVLNWGLPAWLILLPWSTRWLAIPRTINDGWWEYGSVSIYATEVWLIILLIVGGCWWVANGRSQIWPRAWWLASLALVVWSGLSIIWATDWLVATASWRYLVEGFAVVILLSMGVVSRWRLTWSLVISGLVQSVFGWWQVAAQMVPASKWLGLAAQWPAVAGTAVVETGVERWLRVYGSWPHPNMLAIWLALALVTAVWLTTQVKTTAQRWTLIMAAAAMVPIFLATFSRAGYIAAAGGMALMWWLVRQRGQWQSTTSLALVAMTIMTVLFGLGWQSVLVTRLAPTTRLEVQSIDQRQQLLAQANQLLVAHPVLGVGIGNMTAAVRDEIDATKPAWWYQPVHSWYVLPFVELGLIGGALWFIWLVRVGKLAALSPLAPLLVVLLIAGMFDHFLWSLYGGVMMTYIMIGLTLISPTAEPA